MRRRGKLIAAALVFVPGPALAPVLSTPPAVSSPRAERGSAFRIVYEVVSQRMKKAVAGEARAVAEAIIDECARSGVDPLFVLAVIEAESGFDIEAVSPSGARGLMQLMPSTFRLVSRAKRMFDPVENVRAGIRYIRYLYDHGFGRRGGPETTLMAYNQGPGATLAAQRGESEHSDEARAYVPKVMGRYKSLLARHGRKPADARKLYVRPRKR